MGSTQMPRIAADLMLKIHHQGRQQGHPWRLHRKKLADTDTDPRVEIPHDLVFTQEYARNTFPTRNTVVYELWGPQRGSDLALRRR